jgi:hypothetical protein
MSFELDVDEWDRELDIDRRHKAKDKPADEPLFARAMW